MSNPTAPPTRTAPERDGSAPRVLYGLLIVEGWREGGFWSADAFVVAVVSLVILVVSLILDRPDPRGLMLVGSVLALATWWLVRAITAGGARALPAPRGEHAGLCCRLRSHAHAGGTARQTAGLGVAAPRWRRCGGGSGRRSSGVGSPWPSPRKDCGGSRAR